MFDIREKMGDRLRAFMEKLCVNSNHVYAEAMNEWKTEIAT